MSAESLAREHQQMAGWTDDTLLDVLLDYIDNQDDNNGLDDYLTQRRDNESDGGLITTLASEPFRIARDLCSDGGESEYIRACAEMVCDLTGLSTDYKEQVIAALITQDA